MFAILLSAMLSQTPEAVVFVDKGDLFTKAGKKQGLAVGQKVALLGDKIGDTSERRTAGNAIVMEVWDNLARIVPDDANAKPQAVALPKAQAKKAAAPAPAESAAPQQQTQTGTGPGFTDRLSARCEGHDVAVQARATLTGGFVLLNVDGARVADGEVSAGGELNLAGKGAKLRVVQGLFGTDYILQMNGKACTLVNH